MSEEYDWDTYEMFKEQIDIQLPQIESYILDLDKEDLVINAIDELCRTFHNYKEISSYLSLMPLNKIVIKVEAVLKSLKEEKVVVQESIIEWLFKVKDQLEIWSNEMEKQETQLVDVPENLYNKIKISSSYIPPKEKLKKLTIIYVDKNQERARKVIPFLKKLTYDVKYASDIQKCKTILQRGIYHILICNIDKENFELKKIIKNNYPDIKIIAIFNKITMIYLKKLLKDGIGNSIENPLNGKKMERELLSIINTYYSSTNILIDHKKIYDFIQTLQPLPNTIFQIAQICDDDDLHIKDLIKVVKTDPIIAVNILNAANSPMYGSIELKTIDQAITRLGKRAIKALAMSSVYKSLGTINLDAYNIDEDTFSKVSMTRLSLMIKWYSKVSIADLSILSTTALLGNIGQLLISKEIISMDAVDRFTNISNNFSIKYAEEQIVHTSTNHISGVILNYWKLSCDIVDVIAYTDEPSESTKELRKLCVANHIVYKLVDIKANVLDKIPDEILPLMAEYDLDPNILTKALTSILKIK